MPSHTDQLITAAKAHDLWDLQQHIAWTDVIRPRLEQQIRTYSDILVGEALGAAIPGGKTREQVAGIAYGMKYMITLFEGILKDGKRALEQLESEGIRVA